MCPVSCTCCVLLIFSRKPWQPLFFIERLLQGEMAEQKQGERNVTKK